MDKYFSNSQLQSVINLLYNGNIKSFADVIGVHRATLDKYLKNKLVLGREFSERLKNNANINPTWLMYGEGEMLLSEQAENKKSQSNAEFVQTTGTVQLPILKELNKEEKLKTREILKEYLNKLNDSLVDELTSS